MAMLPPANAPGAGSALLSLLQGGGGGGAPPVATPPQNGVPLGGAGGLNNGPSLPAASSLEQLWSSPGQPSAPCEPQLSGADAGRGRGRGRGVCSAALGTAASRPPVSSLAGLSLSDPADGIGAPLPAADSA